MEREREAQGVGPRCGMGRGCIVVDDDDNVGVVGADS